MKPPIFLALFISLCIGNVLSAVPVPLGKLNKLKVLNWNVLYGFNHRKSIKQGIDWINEQKPDVVGLQELNGHTLKSLGEAAKGWGHNHAVILKQGGFPVGLTSRQPIEVIEKRVKGFHHGYLHCKTSGVHFFIVHFWPGKDHEAKLIIGQINKLLLSEKHVIVMGDFNTHSRKDRDALKTSSHVKPSYQVIDMFEQAGFVDLVYKHDRKAIYSFPSPIIIPKWAKNEQEILQKRQRIDFILASAKLAEPSVSATVITSKEAGRISDHYPVVTELKVNK